MSSAVQPSDERVGNQGHVFALPVLNHLEIQRFIDLVYPVSVTGLLNVVHSGDFTGRQFHRADIKNLISYVHSLDCTGSSSIYLRATTIKPILTAGRRGGASDSVELPGLWADLDFGTAGHADRNELPRPPDEASAASIVALSGLPSPTLWVHSGGGIYPWWLLHEPFTITAETQNYLTGLSRKWHAILAAAARTQRWFYGTEASDLARVLRLPGTVNRKVGDRLRPCSIAADDGPRYLLQDLHHAAEAGAQRWGVAVSLAISDPRAGDNATTSFIARLRDPDGPPCRVMAATQHHWVAAIEAAGASCHEEGLHAARAITLDAAKEHRGALTAMEAVRNTWLSIRQPGATTGRALESADEEWSRLEQGAWAKAATRASTKGDAFFLEESKCRCFDGGPNFLAGAPTDTDVDASFWNARPSLKHVHDFALSRRASPWAALGVTLTRVTATAPPKVVLPPLIGGVVSINLFLALVGGSGRGKGAAMRAAKDAVVLCGRGVFDEPAGEHYFDEHKLGTGQAIAHAYAYRDKEGVHRSADSALFMLDEVDHLAGHASQVGSTILAELKCMYMGEKLGSFYVDPIKRIEIKEQTYRAGFIVGVQPEKSQVLFSDTEGGTPQRFVWLPTTYPQPRIKPEGPAPLRWVPPDWEPRSFSPTGDALPWAAGATERSEHIIMPVAASACAAIDQANWEQSTGHGDPLDGHRLLCQEKIAAAFGILGGHVEITEEDWQLAGHLMALSDRTRSGVLDVLAREAAERNTARGKAEASRAVIVDTAKEEAAVKRVARSVVRLVEGHDGWIGHSELRRKIKNTDRPRCDEALSYLLKTGMLEAEKINYQGQDGFQYRVGKI